MLRIIKHSLVPANVLLIDIEESQERHGLLSFLALLLLGSTEAEQTRARRLLLGLLLRLVVHADLDSIDDLVDDVLLIGVFDNVALMISMRKTEENCRN